MDLEAIGYFLVSASDKCKFSWVAIVLRVQAFTLRGSRRGDSFAKYLLILLQEIGDYW